METSEKVADLGECTALYVPTPGWLQQVGCKSPEDPRTRAACVWIADGEYKIWRRFFPDDIKRLLVDLEKLELGEDERQKRIGSILHISRREHRAEILVLPGDGQATHKLTLASWWLNRTNRVGLAERVDRGNANLKPEEFRPVSPATSPVGSHTFFIFLEGCRPDDLRPYTIVQPPG